MRSLNNLFEIVTSYHRYWTGDQYDTFYMCHAVEKSYYDGLITAIEVIRMNHKIIIWMKQEWKRTRIKNILKLKLKYIFEPYCPDRLFDVLQLSPISDEAEIREWWEKKFKTLD
jgi:hypothetical protein